MKIGKVLDWLECKKSKMVLYTYDAFLIDTYPNERDEILKSVTTIMEEGGFPVRAEEGKNYDDLSNYLKGDAGKTVTLTIERDGVADNLVFLLQLEEIVIKK